MTGLQKSGCKGWFGGISSCLSLPGSVASHHSTYSICSATAPAGKASSITRARYFHSLLSPHTNRRFKLLLASGPTTVQDAIPHSRSANNTTRSFAVIRNRRRRGCPSCLDFKLIIISAAYSSCSRADSADSMVALHPAHRGDC